MKNTESGTCKGCHEAVTRGSVVELWQSTRDGRNCPAPGNVYHVVSK